MKDRMKLAKQRVKDKKDFYSSLTAYCIVIPFLFFLNIQSSSEHLWFIYPALGWGIGLATQYWKIWGKGILTEEWEERELDRELERLERRSGASNRNTNIDDHLELKELSSEKEKEEQPRWRDRDLV